MIQIRGAEADPEVEMVFRSCGCQMGRLEMDVTAHEFGHMEYGDQGCAARLW